MRLSSVHETVMLQLALATGLRRGDIDSLKISDIDFETNSIATSSKKTKKSMASHLVMLFILHFLVGFSLAYPTVMA